MSTMQRDPLAKWLENYPDIRAPQGFTERLLPRLDTPPGDTAQDRFRVYGMLCIASALVLTVVLHTPLIPVFARIIQALEGVFS